LAQLGEKRKEKQLKETAAKAVTYAAKNAASSFFFLNRFRVHSPP